MPVKVHHSSEFGRMITVDPRVSLKYTYNPNPLPGCWESFQVTRPGVLQLAPRQTPVLQLHALLIATARLVSESPALHLGIVKEREQSSQRAKCRESDLIAHGGRSCVS